MFVPFLQAISSPLFSPIIVSFDSSEEVIESVEALRKTLPSSQIFTYNDIGKFSNKWLMSRSFSPIILVGHGTEEGILLESGELLTWDELSKWVNMLPNTEVYFLTCNSDSATELTNKRSHGFNGEIDGILGAYSIGNQIHLSNGNIEKGREAENNLLYRFIEIVKGKNVLYLRPTERGSPPPPPPSIPALIGSCTNGYSSVTYIWDCLGLNEAFVHGLNFILIIGGILLPATWVVAMDGVNLAWRVMVSIAKGAIFIRSAGLIIEAAMLGDLLLLFGALAGFVTSLFKFAWEVYNALAWYRQAAAAAAIWVDAATTPIKLSVLAPLVLTAIGLAIYQLYKLFLDHDDKNDLVT
ncbi:MAG: hypothetical protein ACW981_02805 [Candidatus Hodarchaeales archaeon]|jgi:hypothetical protein